MRAQSISVIVTSYNQPNTLRLVLAGFHAQDRNDFELVLADDGSDADTHKLIDEFRVTAPFPTKVVSHERTVFRKARILNLAVLAASGEQLIFCDGDCVPWHNFVSVHARYFRAKSFCVGSYHYLNVEQSRALDPEQVRGQAHEHMLSLGLRAENLWVHAKNVFYGLLDKKNKPKLRGGNFSVPRATLVDVDGFDESFVGFSGEDSDLRNRLRNYGAKGICLFHRAIVCHLDHRLDPRRVDQAVVRLTRDTQLIKAGLRRVRAVKGLSSHLRNPAD